MRSKLFAQELSSMKHTKQFSKEVCAEHTQGARYERFLEVNGLFSEGMEAEVLPTLPQHSAHNAVSLPVLGNTYLLLGAKQVNLESNNFFKFYQWPGHGGHGQI